MPTERIFSLINNYSTRKKKKCNKNSIYHDIDLSDTKKKSDIKNVLQSTEIVFHCAALARVQPSILDPIKYEVNNDELFEYKLCIHNKKKNIGFIGELNSTYTKEFSIDDKIHLLNLDLDNIKLKSANVKYQELSKFPSSRRDLSMILDDNINFEAIKNLAFNVENKILKDVNLFDEYKGKNIEDNKKSLAVSFTFNDSKKTLTDKLIDKIMLKLSDKYKTDLGAVIRDK